MTMGDAPHYHGSGRDRYGHRHPYLHINHDHDHDDRFDEIRDLYRSIAAIPNATLTEGQRDVLWLIDEVERLREMQPSSEPS